MDSVPLRSDCEAEQDDLELHCLHIYDPPPTDDICHIPYAVVATITLTGHVFPHGITLYSTKHFVKGQKQTA